MFLQSNIVALTQGTEAWKNWRKLGGSDMAVILNMSPYKSSARLASEKAGLKDDNFFMTEHVERGQIAEELIKVTAQEILEEKLGLKLNLENICAESVEYPFLTVSYDAFCLENNVIAELKAPSVDKFSELQKAYNELEKNEHGFGVVLNSKELDSYEVYYPQVQYQLAFSNASSAFLACYEVESAELLIFEIVRDDNFIAKMIKKAIKFQSNVEKLRNEFKARVDLSHEQSFVDAIETIKAVDPIILDLKANLASLESQKKEAVNVIDGLLEQARALESEFDGVVASRSFYTGRINYKKIVEDIDDSNIDIEKYRSHGSYRTNIKKA